MLLLTALGVTGILGVLKIIVASLLRLLTEILKMSFFCITGSSPSFEAIKDESFTSLK
jgi:hypothetical protein